MSETLEKLIKKVISIQVLVTNYKCIHPMLQIKYNSSFIGMNKK